MAMNPGILGRRRRDMSVAEQAMADLLPEQATLVAVWQPNDGTSQLLEDSKGSFDAQFGSTAGADTNDPTRLLAEFMNEFVLDDFLHLADAPLPNGYTFASVFERVGNEEDGTLWYFRAASAHQRYLAFGTGADANKLGVVHTGEGGTARTGVVSVGLHDVIVVKGVGFSACDIYLDGVLAATGTFNNPGTGASMGRLGSREGGGFLTNTKKGTDAIWSAPHAGSIAAIRTALKTKYPGLA